MDVEFMLEDSFEVRRSFLQISASSSCRTKTT
jgi:hypothetical protein